MASKSSRPAAPNEANPTPAGPQQAATDIGEQPAVNRKKQKRRQKQAAKLAAEQAAATLVNGQVHTHNSHSSRSHQINRTHPSHQSPQNLDYGQYEPDDLDEARDGDELFYSDDEEPMLGNHSQDLANGKSTKKKRLKNRPDSQAYSQSAYPMPGQFDQAPPPPPPPPSTDMLSKASRNETKDRIWNTSTAEERERIKEFWISLEEPERRSLVKVEKEAVLKKMKEQQKHSCSCSVCGRKRTAIEEELEVLYDAYYEELEQYANHRQIGLDNGHPMMPPPSSYPSMPKVPLRQDPRVMNSQPPNPHPMAGAFETDDDELEEEEYSDDEYDGSEEGYYPPEVAQGPATDFFNFGKSLTVQGGILTVADDLLKNDGKKFIEMMEQLAERRMQREEEAQYAGDGARHSYNGHTHPPLEEDEYEDEEEDYASEEEDYDEEEDEMESMSEEQRMEEGRRMFQIFAARMFEQRVLTAYREKVARERQEKLLEELADEDRLDAEREAKKAKDAQKKKDKKKQQKAAKDEEKRKREAEKAASEAAAKAEEERKLKEQQQRKEEQKKKREAEKKTQEEERQRKEAEKARRQQEAREQQVEQERKQREARERDKKRKEEAKRKEKEERTKEKERKEREAAEKREIEAKARAEKGAQEALERESKARARKDEAAKQSTQVAPAVAVPPMLRKSTSSGIPPPPGLGSASSAHASPHLQIATPVIPKAPTPIRPRQPSRQGSMHSSPKSTQQPSGSSAASPSSAIAQQPPPTSLPPVTRPTPIHSMPPQATLPTAAPPLASPPGIPPQSFPSVSNAPPMSGPGFPSHFHPMPPPGMQPRPPNHHDASIYANQPFSAPPYRSFNSPSTTAFPPGISGPRHAMPPGRGSPTDAPVTQAGMGVGAAPGPIAPTSHSRNASASYESSSSGQTQPIARPNPISRPTNNQPHDSKKTDVDDLSNHLGSSALLDDTEDALGPRTADNRGSIGPAGTRSTRLGFANPRYPGEPSSAKADTFSRAGWVPPSMGFGTPTMSSHPSWPSASGAHWSSGSNAFSNMPSMGRQSRPVSIRLLICQACKMLSNNNPEGLPSGFGYHSIHEVMSRIEHIHPESGSIPLSEFLAICETEGSGANGGGTLVVQEERSRGTCVKWIPDTLPGNARMVGGPGHAGEIGSPIVGSAMAFGSGGGRGFGPHGVGGMQAPNF